MQRRGQGQSPSGAGADSFPWKGRTIHKVARLVLRGLHRSPAFVFLGILFVVFVIGSIASLYALIPEARATRAVAFLRAGRRDEIEKRRAAEFNSRGDAGGVDDDDSGSGSEEPQLTQEPESPSVADVASSNNERGVVAGVADPEFQQGIRDSQGFIVRGATHDVSKRYAKQLEAGNGFTCFDGSEHFPSFKVVNDDYCDCPDGSDEPGTSACSGIPGLALKGFSCSWNSRSPVLSGTVGKLDIIRLGAVNDGICDCCNGEDEWNGEVKCPNRCSELAALAKAEASKAMAGSRAREAYVRKAAKLKHRSEFKNLDGGPENVFLAAAEHCQQFDDGDFTFEVCLYKHVLQKSRQNGGSYTLGNGGNFKTTLWENGEQRKDYSVLVMGGGDYCHPASAPRKAEIHFECGTEQAILSVQEAQVCVYKIRMRTPAACHSLQHHDT
eukprot:TRINITY_DN109576_c0_g1_i1.p1 TRINITY_DN109576_c0_g1~~TRINITY_DN109576_c0_g1_i1.p1  ORF type:complete len:441 (-),score=88.74 TRINITY_DN109576_c0_g1_i1:175-1497(-)